MVSGLVKPEFRSRSFNVLPALERHRERHFHLAAPLGPRLRPSSYTEMPSVSQRGMR